MAISKTVTIDIELERPNDLVLVHAVQGEYYSREVIANLKDGGVDYTIPSEAVALIRYRKPDGKVGFYDFDPAGNRIVNIQSNNKSVKFTIAEDMCSIPGRVVAHIDLYSKTSGNRLSAFYFHVDVEKAATDPEIYVVSNAGGVQDLLKDIIGNIYTPGTSTTGAVIDPTLTIPGAVGDAKAMGDVVLVQPEEPDSSITSNKLWVDSDSTETGIEVPDILDIVGSYSDTKRYSNGDFVNYEGKIYKYVYDSDYVGSWNKDLWELVPISNDITRNGSDLSSIKDMLYPNNYIFDDSVIAFTHTGINLNTGGMISASTAYGLRSATSKAIRIPEKGLKIEMDPAFEDRWFFGVWCYKTDSISSSNFTYSPTDCRLIPAGQSVIVANRNGSKYCYIQCRCIDDDPANANYGGARPLIFDADSESDISDETVIKSAIHVFVSEEPDYYLETSKNLIKKSFFTDAELLGMTVDGVTIHGDNSAFEKGLYLVKGGDSILSGNYSLTFDYIAEVSPKWLYIMIVAADGTETAFKLLDPSSVWRHFSSTISLEPGMKLYICVQSGSQTDNIQLKNVQLLYSDRAEKYLPDFLTPDYKARTDLDSIVETGDNLFDFQSFMANASGVRSDEIGLIRAYPKELLNVGLLDVSSMAAGTKLQVSLWLKTAQTTSNLGLAFRTANNDYISQSSASLYGSDSRYYQNLRIMEVPEGAKYLGFYRTSSNFNSLCNIKNIVIKVKADSLGGPFLSSGREETSFGSKTAIDMIARNRAKNAVLNNSEIFRLDFAPDYISYSSYEDFISKTWDTFLADYPMNVTKETIGQSTYPNPQNSDESLNKQFDIYRYVITPFNTIDWAEKEIEGVDTEVLSSTTVGYEKTVLITAGCHGNEHEGYIGLYHLMRIIYESSYKYPKLRRLRNHIRFIIIPVWNPWGMTADRRILPVKLPDSKGEYHSRYNASPYSFFGGQVSSYGGETYTEETVGETKALLDTLKKYKCDLWLDMHTDPYSGYGSKREGGTRNPKDLIYSGCYAYAPAKTELANMLYDLTCDFYNIYKNELNYSYEQLYFNTSAPGSSGHPAYGISQLPTATIEFSTNMGLSFTDPEDADKHFPYPKGSPELMKLAVEWYGNCLAEAVKVI